jgi:hypothetical protein
MKYLVAAVLLCSAGAVLAQPAFQAAPAGSATPTRGAPALRPATASIAVPPAKAAPAAPAAPVTPTLMLRGLEKITGRPTNIVAPIGKPVKFETLTITARYCYSTPASETPETAAFVQIDDHRPDQSARRVFSGWMYASSPGLNGMEHPLYDVWVISCNNGTALAAANPAAPVAVAAPDSSDKEQTDVLPEDAGK